MEAARRVTGMIPDLRFVVGAVIATALLGVTLFGLAAAMHISHQSKISPLEASRLLAYAPESRHRIFDIPAPRLDSPFANIPADPNPVPLQQPSEPAEPPQQTAATAQPAPDAQASPAAQPASPPRPANDADTVDERAVVDPPLPLDNDPPAAAAESAPAAPPPESAAAAAPPVETTPAAAAPVAEQPAAAQDVQQVGSIPTTTDAAVTDVTETQAAPKAKRKRTARKAKAKRPAQRATAPVDPFGYPAGTTSTANRPARGFWPLD